MVVFPRALVGIVRYLACAKDEWKDNRGELTDRTGFCCYIIFLIPCLLWERHLNISLEMKGEVGI